MNKQILEAPNYQIDEKGVITNIAKGNVVLPNKAGDVGLYTEKPSTFGGRPIKEKVRVFLKVTDLLKQYHGEIEKTEQPKKEKPKKEEVKSYKDFKKATKKEGGPVSEIHSLIKEGKSKKEILEMNKFKPNTVKTQWWMYHNQKK